MIKYEINDELDIKKINHKDAELDEGIYFFIKKRNGVALLLS
jgi:hypothetical protein